MLTGEFIISPLLYDSGQSMLPSLMSSMMSWGARPEIGKRNVQLSVAVVNSRGDEFLEILSDNLS